MMAEVEILHTGFSRLLGPGIEQAACTIALIRGAKTNTIVDTGSPTDKERLETSLAQRGLRPHNIQFIVCTHGHADHTGNNNLFPAATIVSSLDVTKGDLFLSHDWTQPLALDEDVSIEPAPGHTVKHNAVLAQTARGLVLIAGDTFIHEGDEDERETWLRHSELPEQHLETRRRLRQRVTFIIPGHGPMFPVT